MKKMNMYVAPKAEVIEMQTVTVLMESTTPTETTNPIPGGDDDESE